MFFFLWLIHHHFYCEFKFKCVILINVNEVCFWTFSNCFFPFGGSIFSRSCSSMHPIHLNRPIHRNTCSFCLQKRFLFFLSWKSCFNIFYSFIKASINKQRLRMKLTLAYTRATYILQRNLHAYTVYDCLGATIKFIYCSMKSINGIVVLALAFSFASIIQFDFLDDFSFWFVCFSL